MPARLLCTQTPKKRNAQKTPSEMRKHPRRGLIHNSPSHFDWDIFNSLSIMCLLKFVSRNFEHKKNSEAGDDLLSREANRSTIGAGGLNFRVRHGTGWTPSAILTCFHCSIKTDKTVSAFRFPYSARFTWSCISHLPKQHESKTG